MRAAQWQQGSVSNRGTSDRAGKTICSQNAELLSIDGLRVDYADRWGLIRASNTQPVNVMRIEAQNEILLDQIRKKFEAALSRAAEKLGHEKFNYESSDH